MATPSLLRAYLTQNSNHVALHYINTTATHSNTSIHRCIHVQDRIRQGTQGEGETWRKLKKYSREPPAGGGDIIYGYPLALQSSLPLHTLKNSINT